MSQFIDNLDVLTLISNILLMLATIALYQSVAYLQNKSQLIWLNPMLLSIVAIIPLLLFFELPFEQYDHSTQFLSNLLEPAVVALGFPLYQHLNTIKHQWKALGLILALGVVLVIVVSFTLTMLFIAIPKIAVSLSLKSITTPIGLALSQQLNGDDSITAFAIILAGVFGALFGPSWLNFINVKSAKAQGLAIGAASHALGTATISKISYEHGAYGSLALIICALITSLVSPILINILSLWLL
jgi:predicted murein hydrolase (TIGR00659 family)